MAKKEFLAVVCGLPGTGKSEVSKRLAMEVSAKRLNTDVIRKRLYQEPTYSKEESEHVYAVMYEIAEYILARGKSVVLDGTFNSEVEREKVKKILENKDILFSIIEIVCSDEELVKRRLEARMGTGNPSDADWEVYQRVAKKFVPIAEGHLTIDNTAATIDGIEEYIPLILAFIDGE